MLSKFFFCVAVCLAGVALASDADDLAAASRKLADTGNYSWKTTNQTPGVPQRSNVQEGKTQKDGLTWMITHFGNDEVQFFSKGEKFVFKTRDGWKTTAEIQQQGESDGIDRLRVSIAQNFKPPAHMAVDTPQKGPVVKTGDAYVTEIAGEAAKNVLLGSAGRKGAQPDMGYQVKEARISTKVWIKDGMVSKDVSRTTATITVNGEDRNIDRETTIEFSAIGSTHVDVPAEVKQKLE